MNSNLLKFSQWSGAQAKEIGREKGSPSSKGQAPVLEQRRQYSTRRRGPIERIGAAPVAVFINWNIYVGRGDAQFPLHFALRFFFAFQI